MKIDKKYLIIGGILLLVLLVVLVLIFVFGKDKPENSNKPIEVQRIAKLELEYDEIKKRYGNGFVVSKGSKYGVIKENGDILLDVEYDDYNPVGEYAYYLLKDNLYYYINHDNKVIFSTSNKLEVLEYPGSKIYYFISRDNNKTIVYDYTGKEIYSVDEEVYFDVTNEYIIYENKIVNYKTGEIYNNVRNLMLSVGTNSIEYNNEIYQLEKGYLLRYYDSGEMVYYDTLEKVEQGYLLKNDNETVLYEYTEFFVGGITQPYSKKDLNDKVYIDYDECDIGFTVYYEDERIDNTCYKGYNKSSNSKIILLAKDQYEKALFENGKTRVIDEYVVFLGNHLASNANLDVYNSKNEEVFLGDRDYCYYTGKDMYICKKAGETYLYDGNLNKLLNREYDDIVCYEKENACILNDAGKYDLYYDGKYIIEPIYYGYDEFDGYIVMKKSEGVDLYKFN